MSLPELFFRATMARGATSELRTALLQERTSLEQRLQHVNVLLQNDGIPSAVSLPRAASSCQPNAQPNVLRIDTFGETIGLAPESGRFVLFVFAIAFVYARGRAFVHTVGVLIMYSIVTSAMLLRRLSRVIWPRPKIMLQGSSGLQQ